VYASEVFQLPFDSAEEKTGFQEITRWLELADEALNRRISRGKRA